MSDYVSPYVASEARRLQIIRPDCPAAKFNAPLSEYKEVANPRKRVWIGLGCWAVIVGLVMVVRKYL